jgi:hypothetical protein
MSLPRLSSSTGISSVPPTSQARTARVSLSWSQKSEALLAGRWSLRDRRRPQPGFPRETAPAWRQGERDWRGSRPGQRPLPCQHRAAVWADLMQALREHRLDVTAGPGDSGTQLLGHVHGDHILHTKRVCALSAGLHFGVIGFWLGGVIALENPSREDDTSGRAGWSTASRSPANARRYGCGR